MNKTAALLVLMVVFVAGCAVPYQKKGVYGGYTDFPLSSDNVIRVTYEGDGRYITEANIFNYLLYRCAEVTVEKGFDYFVCEDASGGSTMNAIIPAGGMFIPVNTATASMTIRLHKGMKPDEPKTYDARELMRNLVPHIKLSEQ